MTDIKDALRKIEEALDKGGFHATAAGHIEDAIDICHAVNVCKAIRDAVPDGLDQALRTIIVDQQAFKDDLFALRTRTKAAELLHTITGGDDG